MAAAHDLCQARPAQHRTTPSRRAGVGLPAHPPASPVPAPNADPAPGAGLSVGYLSVGGLALASYFFLPAAGGWIAVRLVVCCGMSLSAAIAVVVGIRRFRPDPRTPWLLIGVAQFSYAAGDAIFYPSHYLAHATSFPAPSDAFYLVHYPLLVAGLLPIARRRAPGGDLPALLDGLLVATAATTLSSLHLIGPRLDEHLSTLTSSVGVAYPLADIVLLTIGVRLLVGAGSRPRAFLLLTASLFGTLTADTGYALRLLANGYTVGGIVDGGWLVGNLMLGAAALHPTMARIAQPAPAAAAELGRGRLIALYLIGIIAPLTLAAGSARANTGTELVTAGATAVSIALIMVRMRNSERRQRQLANTDVLTGLSTRRHLDRQLDLLTTRLTATGTLPDRRRAGARSGDGQPGTRRASRSVTTVALLLIDVDHFKAINDRYGHPAGDRALTEIAGRLRAAGRSCDVVARYGGEEFALLVTQLEAHEVGGLGERLRASVAGGPMLVADGTQLVVTVSVGAAFAAVPASPAELVDRADRALYAAKAAGRDRVVVAEPTARPVLASLTAGPGWWTRATWGGASHSG